MGGLISKPKIPAPPPIAQVKEVAKPAPVVELPDEDSPLAKAQRRRQAALRGGGVKDTLLASAGAPSGLLGGS